MALEAARPPRRSPGRLPACDVPAAWLGAIVAAAAVLRLVPIWFGLPYLHARPDEETAIGHAVAMLGGDLNPHFFHWPSLTFYLFAAMFAAWTAAVTAVSGHAAVTDVEYVLLARGMVAMAGTLTTVVLFHLVRRATDVATGLLAAAFLAVAILHVRESHFAMTDVLMTLLLTASLALLLGALDQAVAAPDRRRVRLAPFAVAGFAGGLAASTKYSAGAVVVAMAAAQIVLARRFRQRWWEPRTWPPSLAFLAACAAGFFLATPYALLDAGTFAADLRFDFTHLAGGHSIDLGRGWWYHATHSLPYGVGFFTLLAAGAGIVPFARDRPREAFVLGTFAAAFYLAIGSGHTVFFRYILPLVPIVCLLAAVGVRYGRTVACRESRRVERDGDRPAGGSRPDASARQQHLVRRGAGPYRYPGARRPVAGAADPAGRVAARRGGRLRDARPRPDGIPRVAFRPGNRILWRSGRAHTRLARAPPVAATPVRQDPSRPASPRQRTLRQGPGVPGHPRPRRIRDVRPAGRVLHAPVPVPHRGETRPDYPDLPKTHPAASPPSPALQFSRCP